MSDELLKRATDALRATTEAPNPRSGLTRARVLEGAEKRSRARRGFGLRLALVLAGLFTVGTALARVDVLLPKLREALGLRAVSRPAAPQRMPPPRSAPGRGPREPPAADTEPLLPSMSATVSDAGADQGKASVTRASKPHRRAPSPRATLAPEAAAAPTATPAPESAELALFRRAQALHLARDPGALAAWDAYLRVAEHGALVPEASYNRALCLVRLGRHAAARAALEPFARGEFGGYRRAEAEALLATLPR